MTYRVIVNGALGKMGRAACDAIDAHPEFLLVGRLSAEDDLSSSIITLDADIVIDLTRADSVFKNTKTIIDLGAHPVIGTSGLNSENIKLLQEMSAEKKLGGIIVPNFSIGAILMMECAEKIAAYFNDVEIIEIHHEQKQDAPSGTAMKTAEMIAKVKQKSDERLPEHELVQGARGGRIFDIPVHSLRLPGFLAEQQVIFGQKGESLTITHRTLDRQCFMPGLIRACLSVVHLDSLVYGLENVL